MHHQFRPFNLLFPLALQPPNNHPTLDLSDKEGGVWYGHWIGLDAHLALKVSSLIWNHSSKRGVSSGRGPELMHKQTPQPLWLCSSASSRSWSWRRVDLSLTTSAVFVSWLLSSVWVAATVSRLFFSMDHTGFGPLLWREGATLASLNHCFGISTKIFIRGITVTEESWDRGARAHAVKARVRGSCPAGPGQRGGTPRDGERKTKPPQPQNE